MSLEENDPNQANEQGWFRQPYLPGLLVTLQMAKLLIIYPGN